VTFHSTGCDLGPLGFNLVAAGFQSTFSINFDLAVALAEVKRRDENFWTIREHERVNRNDSILAIVNFSAGILKVEELTCACSTKSLEDALVNGGDGSWVWRTAISWSVGSITVLE